MKKYLAWALAILMMLSLFAACAGDEPSPIATPEPIATPVFSLQPAFWP